MKKRGFTLIELLAVIVVLAIIALIATPIVTNTIKEVKKESIERGADNYLKQVELTITAKRMDGIKIKDGVYVINENGNLENENLNDEIKIELSGNKPSSGYIVIENREITKEKSFMRIGNYSVNYINDSLDAELVEKVLCKANITPTNNLLFDIKLYPQSPFLSENYITDEVGFLAKEVGPYNLGVSYTCDLGDGEKIFYVLENNDDTVSLILGTNLGHTVAYCSDQTLCKTDGEWDNTKGPITALNYLKDTTKDWTKLEESQISLPSAEQIAKASDQVFNNVKIKDLPTWLYSYTDTNFGFGYWTTTPSLDVNKYAYIVYARNGTVSAEYDMYANGYHIRPVITIKKSQIS